MINKEPIALNGKSLCITFTSSCRDAMKQIYSSISVSRPNSYILVPSYIGLSTVEGSGVFDPLVESKIRYKFYKLNFKLEPDLDHINQLIEEGNVASILIINYFGRRPDNLEILLEICNRKEILTIEDNAHCLPRFFDYLTKDSIPSDFAVFSIHKYLGTESGGILISKKQGNYSFENSINISDLIVFSSSNFEEVIEKRRRNFEIIRNFFEKYVGNDSTAFFRKSDDDIDNLLNFPITFKSKEDRHSAYGMLSKVGIHPTSLYHRLIPQIDYLNFPISKRISDTIMNLPTHQDAEKSDIELMLSILNDGGFF
jgi:dTDP-4-amino-4,6-dideoxygalactose transaminase